MITSSIFALALLSADKTEYKRSTVIDFSDVQITAQVIRPEGSYVTGRKRTKFRPLIRHRGDFRPELQKSLDQI